MGLILSDTFQAVQGTPWGKATHFRKDTINTCQLAPACSIFSLSLSPSLPLSFSMFDIKEKFLNGLCEHIFPNKLCPQTVLTEKPTLLKRASRKQNRKSH
jgi:hypothetical protein